jgi:hypothetical protein
MSPPNDLEYTLKVANRLIWPERAAIPSAPDLKVFQPPAKGPSNFSTEGWATLKSDELESWIGTKFAEEPIPIFELTPPEQFPRLVQATPPESLQRMERRSESGTIELKLRMPERTAMTHVTDAFLEGLVRIANNEDNRSYLQSAFPNSETVVTDLYTRILPENLPVIGPGGRVTVYREPDGAQVDFVVRHREKEIPSTWRQPTEIAESIRRRIPNYDEMIIQGNFGYYELSKYARQIHLRPAFLFLLDVSVSIEPARRINWREQVVVAASTAKGLGLTEGVSAAS